MKIFPDREIVSALRRQLNGLCIRQREICNTVRSGLIWMGFVW